METMYSERYEMSSTIVWRNFMLGDVKVCMKMAKFLPTNEGV